MIQKSIISKQIKTTRNSGVDLRRKWFHALVLFLLQLFWSKPSHAYLDPGTGSQLFQILAAGLLGALYTIKIYWQKVKLFFRKTFGRNHKK